MNFSKELRENMFKVARGQKVDSFKENVTVTVATSKEKNVGKNQYPGNYSPETITFVKKVNPKEEQAS